MVSLGPIFTSSLLAVGQPDVGPICLTPLVSLSSSRSPIDFKNLDAIQPTIGPMVVGPLSGPLVARSPIDLSILTAAAPQLLRADQVRAPLLDVIRSANMNSTADQPLSLGSKRFVLRRVIVTNPSVSMTTAAGGIYTGASKTGTAVVSAGQSYSGLTSSSKFIELTLNAPASTDTFVNGILYLSLTTPQGATATADFYIYGDAVEA